MLDTIVSAVSDALYSYILIILLLAGGVYFTIATRFAPFRLFKEQLRAVMEKRVLISGADGIYSLPCGYRKHNRCFHSPVYRRLRLGVLDVGDSYNRKLLRLCGEHPRSDIQKAGQ